MRENSSIITKRGGGRTLSPNDSKRYGFHAPFLGRKALVLCCFSNKIDSERSKILVTERAIIEGLDPTRLKWCCGKIAILFQAYLSRQFLSTKGLRIRPGKVSLQYSTML